MVRFDRFNSKREAYKALAEMGNEVLRGARFRRRRPPRFA